MINTRLPWIKEHECASVEQVYITLREAIGCCPVTTIPCFFYPFKTSKKYLVVRCSACGLTVTVLDGKEIVVIWGHRGKYGY